MPSSTGFGYSSRKPGRIDKWVLISQENPFVDPMKLEIGQMLRLPAKNGRLEDIPPKLLDELTREVVYVVGPNDTLSDIAQQFYGRPSLWRIIHQANRDVVRDPDRVNVGTELVIPRHQIPAE